MKQEKFDLIFSLGGNCTAAHNLRYRKMRFYSLPFDWCYIKDIKPIEVLTKCFKDGDFSKLLNKNNMKELGINPSHLDKIQYQDTYSGYIFANHFTAKIENGGFDIVKNAFNRRIKRLLKLIKNSNKIMLILTTNFEFDISKIQLLKQILEKRYPNKNFIFKIMIFNSVNHQEIIEESIYLNKYTRDFNDNDFLETNDEWKYLDNIKLNTPFLTLMKFYFLQGIIRLIPKKSWRKELRRRYYVQ